MGYRRAEVSDIPAVSSRPAQKNSCLIDEPHPVDIFGEEKPISEKKLSKYLTDDIFHYIDVYENNNKFGFPYRDWTEMPQWLIDLHKMFDRLKAEYEHCQASKHNN